jgi:enoyl-CoA hydratase/carnithine racemase
MTVPTHSPSEEAGDLVLTRYGPIATLWLNRPVKRNAVTQAMWQGITAHCSALADDDGVRLLVVRSTGPDFCSGADIAELEHITPADYQRANRLADEALACFPKPTIAFITGACIGGGCEIAIACDLRLADATARLGVTPARLGIIYPTYALERVVTLIGPAATKHLLYSAEIVDADRALRIGLVTEVLEPVHAEHRLDELTSRLASERSLLTQQASKEMIDDVIEHGSVRPETAERWRTEVTTSTDATEGITAFLERRPPHFTWPERPGDDARALAPAMRAEPVRPIADRAGRWER